MKVKLAAALAALLLAPPLAALEEPYGAVRRGTKCDLEPDGSLTCRYRVGASLEFILHRVGESGVRLRILREDPWGDYALDPVPHGSCLFVRYGWGVKPPTGEEHGYATISTVNGLAYRSLRRCIAAR
jgi:hypothetical protein